EHYVILVDGRAVGLIQTYVVADNPDWEAIVQVGPGVAGVDILIGEEELTGRGLGPQVLAKFVEECSRGPRLRPAWRPSKTRTGARGERSRRPASGTSATSRRTAFPTD